ncbi:MAG TPA: hypothetical protein VFJ19_03480 [Nocardioidaceae bacterium]|nr:hypothetical protein [Nocardioidaceae bacterium]
MTAGTSTPTVTATRRGRRGSGLARAPFLALGGFAMLAGLDAALMLLGVPAPVTADRLPEVHGMLMVLGFVGTLVALERAVALRRPAGFLAPGLLGAGGLLLVSPLPEPAGKLSLLLGAAAFAGVYVPLWRRQRDDAVLVQALGAVLATGAAALWLAGVSMPMLIPWLTGFVVLTIAGERLELARIAMGAGAGTRLLLLSGGLVVAVAASLLWPAVGFPLLGFVLLVLVGWLVQHDIARRTIKTRGLTRFMAACMLAGYFWLGVAGAIWMIRGPTTGGPGYDAVVHAVFLGFTISMIIAHAPVILPAVLRRPLPYHPAMWLAAVLLHASLAVRLWLGDARQLDGTRQVGGVLNEVALLGFLAVAAWFSARRAGGSR